MNLSYHIEIKAPIETIFAFIEDHGKLKQWMDGLQEAKYTSDHDPANRLGAKFKRTLQESGQIIEYQGEVVSYNKPSHFGMLLENKQFSLQVDYRLQTIANGTRLTYTAEMVKSGWLIKTMANRLKTTLTDRLERQMQKLKEITEKLSATPLDPAALGTLPITESSASSSSAKTLVDTNLRPITQQPPRLIVHTPEQRWEILLDAQERWTIGRALENDIVIHHQKVSRRHAVLERDQENFIIRDLNSGNGIWHNQQRIQTHTLRLGDILNIGHAQLEFATS